LSGRKGGKKRRGEAKLKKSNPQKESALTSSWEEGGEKETGRKTERKQAMIRLN